VKPLLLLTLFVLPLVRPASQDLPPAPEQPGSAKSILQEGYASWYGWKFHGRLTASGEIFDMGKLTAAHPTLPFGTILRVTNTANNESVEVKVNDRGPFVEGRIIDLSKAAADAIGMSGSGVAWVRLELMREPPEPQYSVQVGAYTTEKYALRTAERIEAAQLKATVQRTEDGIIRVLVPDVPQSDLQHVISLLKSAGYPNVLVRSVDPSAEAP
jgi:rare lipoprotein A